jgi:hypothetical protein
MLIQIMISYQSDDDFAGYFVLPLLPQPNSIPCPLPWCVWGSDSQHCISQAFFPLEGTQPVEASVGDWKTGEH